MTGHNIFAFASANPLRWTFSVFDLRGILPLYIKYILT